MPAYPDIRVGIAALVKHFLILQVGVQMSGLAAAVSVTATVVDREHIVPTTRSGTHIGTCGSITPAASLHMSLTAGTYSRPGHDIDGTHK